MLFIGPHLNLGDVAFELAKIDLLLEPFQEKPINFDHFQRSWRTHISSISAGVRRVNSGRMNQAMAVETVPVPAKLWGRIQR